MTREDILAALRDIHLPVGEAAPQLTGIAWWPYGVLAAIALGVWLLRRWRANAWRREARRALTEIERMADPIQQWQALLSLTSAIARQAEATVGLPECIYWTPERISARERMNLVEHLKRQL